MPYSWDVRWLNDYLCGNANKKKEKLTLKSVQGSRSLIQASSASGGASWVKTLSSEQVSS